MSSTEINPNAKVSVRDLNLYYGDFHALKGLNIDIPANKVTAFIGPSGCGKSTCLKTLNRMNDLVDGCKITGKITIDGEDIYDPRTDINLLRKRAGMVFQKANPFPMSIYDNIAYGKPGASREEVIEAAKKAGADEFIRGLRDGYDTYVGERGVKLSGGQKQRISIARVFLKNPPIIILDEATSALDESEYAVAKSLNELAKGRTTLTIAHRLSSIRNSDRILVLTDEGIVEEGNHDELMALGGIYHQFYVMANEIK